MQGWDGEGTVWRQEFQFKRQALRELGIATWQDFLANKAKIWEHFCKRWLRVVEVNPYDTNNRRWGVAKFWDVIANYYGDWGANIPKIKKEPKPVSQSYKFRNGFSAIVGHMASNDITDVREAIKSFMEEAAEYHGGQDGLLHYLKSKFKVHLYAQAKRSKRLGFFVPSNEYMVNGLPQMQFAGISSDCPF